MGGWELNGAYNNFRIFFYYRVKCFDGTVVKPFLCDFDTSNKYWTGQDHRLDVENKGKESYCCYFSIKILKCDSINTVRLTVDIMYNMWNISLPVYVLPCLLKTRNPSALPWRGLTCDKNNLSSKMQMSHLHFGWKLFL